MADFHHFDDFFWGIHYYWSAVYKGLMGGFTGLVGVVTKKLEDTNKRLVWF